MEKLPLLHGSVEELPARRGRQRVTAEARAALDVWLRVGDLLLVPGAAALTHIVTYGWLVPTHPQRVVFGAVLLCTLVCFGVAPVYRDWRNRGLLADLWTLLLGWTGVFALFSMYAVLIDMADTVPASWLVGWYSLALVAMSATRVGIRFRLHWLRARGLDRQRVLLVGLRAPALKVHRLLRSRPEIGKEVIGYFAGPDDIALRREGADAPKHLGDLDGLEAYLDAHRGQIEQIWVSLPLGGRARLKDVLRLLERYPVQVRLVPDITGLGALNPGVHQVGNVPMIGVRQGVVEPRFLIIKRVEDFLVAGIAVVLLSPLLGVLALGVKLSSPGPILFRQRRHGLDGKEFWMLKFRSMRVHAEAPDKLTQAIRNDPRVTRFGAFLRRSSLDELPQFFNVLGGSMSVVGPRPHAVQHNNQYERLIERYMHRHYVKPGITGWAQVHGLRGETPQLRQMKKRVQYDIDYIRRWSPLLDVRIIALTVLKVLGQRTAY
ncbi:undecaprenyl-phosphate glucose phosphotransferase [Stenotrophomonas sp. Ste96]|jgi:undecaprenyl-phosphate glucose phosphotransferase|uniref:undecaprenyl-phosphate glucose phosphotransferase n=1 Tax=Stenotrophomonas sp. Ste96 TaxID=2926029 RepID=UPI002905B2B4|nr:undecaprenyl-phosphate glucose phosphotransferase [Stenotrophomonas sp. Ste96]